MEVIELTKALISCQSVTPKNDGVLDLLEKELSNIGFDCRRYLFSDSNTPDVDNLFAKIGSGAPHICFGGHTDVVPVGDIDAWSFDPFNATEKDGKVYGRGASDMKSAIAAFVCAVKEYIENNELKGTVSLLITNDEEGPAINGTKKVLEEIYKNGEKINSFVGIDLLQTFLILNIKNEYLDLSSKIEYLSIKKSPFEMEILKLNLILHEKIRSNELSLKNQNVKKSISFKRWIRG